MDRVPICVNYKSNLRLLMFCSRASIIEQLTFSDFMIIEDHESSDINVEFMYEKNNFFYFKEITEE